MNPGGIRTQNTSKRAAADLRLRPRPTGASSHQLDIIHTLGLDKSWGNLADTHELLASKGLNLDFETLLLLLLLLDFEEQSVS